MSISVLFIGTLLGSAAAFAPIRATPAGVRKPIAAALSSELALVARTPPQPAVHRRAPAPEMGLFGLGTPELAIIAGVALLVLGPDQVKKLAKDVGKVSAELKQVPEEFNKGMKAARNSLD